MSTDPSGDASSASSPDTPARKRGLHAPHLPQMPHLPAALEAFKPPPLPQRWVPWLIGALVIGGLTAGLTWLQPPHPKRVVVSTGITGGGYHAFAQQYKAALAKHDISLELMPSAGAVENLGRLSDPNSGVDAALFQSGLPNTDKTGKIVSLGHMFYEPIWLFSNGTKPITDIRELAGLRVAVGASGSGTEAVALDLLKTYGVNELPTRLFELSGQAAVKALRDGAVDAAFFVQSPKAPITVDLLRDKKIKVANFERADAMVRMSSYLRKITLPAGVVDPVADLPAQDVTLVATTAVLLAREDLHPVIMDLLIEAAREVHGPGSVLAPPGMFPNNQPGQFELAREAQRFYKEGRGTLRDYLPLTTAIWTQRLMFLMLPALAILGPILHFGPIVWRWHMRRRIYRWYGELRLIEDAVTGNRGDAKQQLRRIFYIDKQLQSMGTPLAFSNDLYSLRAHLRFVHDMLEERIGERSRAILTGATAVAAS